MDEEQKIKELERAIKPEHMAEIRRIVDSIPEELKNNVTEIAYEFPTIIEVVELTLNNPDTPEETRKRLEAIKQMGDIYSTIEIENEETTKKIEAYLEEEFEKSRRLGRLPSGDELLEIRKKAGLMEENKEVNEEVLDDSNTSVETSEEEVEVNEETE